MTNVRIIVGDLFESKAQTLVNTVNTVGVMGKGVALGFKKKYPKMFEDYKRRCDLGEVRLGEPYVYQVSAKRQILNFPTKDHWRSVSKLSDIEAGLSVLRENFRAWGIESLAVPPLGCGLGGLDWSVVGPTMHRYLSDLGIPVELYAPHGTPPEQLGMDFLTGGAVAGRLEHTFIEERRLSAGLIAIAAVVSYVERQGEAWPIGRTRLQKIAYFLTEAGIDTGLKFERGSYGPFSGALKKVVSRLVNNGVLTEDAVGKTIAVRVGPTYNDARDVHKAKLIEWSSIIQKVGDLFLRLPTADAAELAASAAFVARECAAQSDKKVSEFVVYKEVLKWKERRKPSVDRYKLAQTVRELNVGSWVNLKVSKRLPVDDVELLEAVGP